MNGALTRTLTLISKKEKIDVIAECCNETFNLKLNNKTIVVQFVSFADNRLTVLLDGVKLGALIVPAGRDLSVFLHGRAVSLHLYVHGSGDDEVGGEGRIIAPMPGKIIDVMVGQGDMVEKDQPLLVMEAMKMEMTIRAGCGGVIEELPVAVNDQVEDGTLLVSIKNEDAA